MIVPKYALLRSNPGAASAVIQRKSVEKYASKENTSVTDWIEDSPGSRRELQKANTKLVKALKDGSCLIVSEISVLGPSFTIVSEILLKLLSKKIVTYSVKEKILLDGKKLTQLQAGLVLFRKVDNSLIAHRISKGQTKRMVSGKNIGRPKGVKSIRTKLSGKEDQIRDYVKRGLSYTAIGKLLDVNRLTVKSFILKHGLKPK